MKRVVVVVGNLVPACLVLAAVLFAKAGTDSEKLIVFHAGSLSVPLARVCDEFVDVYPGVRILREAAGSRLCARKISEFHKPCDIFLSSDYTVIEDLLVPDWAGWNIKFAGNEMVIAFVGRSHYANRVNDKNWPDILLRPDVSFGRSDPNCDPCGYRSVFVIMLAEEFYGRCGLTDLMLKKDRRYIRPKEVDLLSLLQAGEVDYIFIYRSVAIQHGLNVLRLPDRINLGNARFAGFYKRASLRLSGKGPQSFIIKRGEPITYGLTIPQNAPNRRLALQFVTFLLDRGASVLEETGHTLLIPSPAESFQRLPGSLEGVAIPAEPEQSK